jgi:hypothetical protein
LKFHYGSFCSLRANVHWNYSYKRLHAHTIFRPPLDFPSSSSTSPSLEKNEVHWSPRHRCARAGCFGALSVSRVLFLHGTLDHSDRSGSSFADIFTTIVTPTTTSSAAIRQPVNNSPVTSATDTNLRCNVNRAASATVSVAAGSSVTFKLDNTLYHTGPATFYRMSRPWPWNL